MTFIRNEAFTMSATMDRVKKLIEEKFPNSDTSGIEEEGHRVFGEFVWPGFKDMPSRDRNRLVTDRVRSESDMTELT
jgi:hypothetical protein